MTLLMQDEIAQLEEKLHEEDRRMKDSGHDNGTFRHDHSQLRNGILHELAMKLERYRM